MAKLTAEEALAAGAADTQLAGEIAAALVADGLIPDRVRAVVAIVRVLWQRRRDAGELD